MSSIDRNKEGASRTSRKVVALITFILLAALNLLFFAYGLHWYWDVEPVLLNFATSIALPAVWLYTGKITRGPRRFSLDLLAWIACFAVALIIQREVCVAASDGMFKFPLPDTGHG